MSQQNLPGANTVLVMGIVSVIGTLVCCGPFGAIFSIIALIQAKTANKLYLANPELYSDYSLVKTGKVLAYIGLVLSLIMLVLVIVYFGFIVALIASESGNWDNGY